VGLKGKFRGAKGSAGGWVKGADGKFNGSTPGTVRLGGKRGLKERVRLRQALQRVETARKAHGDTKAAGADATKSRKRLKRALGAARLHQREVARIEKRGHQPIVMRARKATAQRATPEVKIKRLKGRLRKQREKLEGLEGGRHLIAARGQSTHFFDRPISKATKASRRLKSALERLRGAKSG
jgi:succinate dehydrogenase/fumarate reductase flavoprotein subunit